MRSAMAAICLFVFVGVSYAGSPEALPDSLPMASFRVETGEVHIQLSAFDKHNVPVADLTSQELQVVRDGIAIRDVVDLRQHEELPITATILTDTSESMGKSVSIAREGWSWLSANVIRPTDQVELLDFNDVVSRPNTGKM